MLEDLPSVTTNQLTQSLTIDDKHTGGIGLGTLHHTCHGSWFFRQDSIIYSPGQLVYSNDLVSLIRPGGVHWRRRQHRRSGEAITTRSPLSIVEESIGQRSQRMQLQSNLDIHDLRTRQHRSCDSRSRCRIHTSSGRELRFNLSQQPELIHLARAVTPSSCCLRRFLVRSSTMLSLDYTPLASKGTWQVRHLS